jgi:hypothetical protein
MFLIEVSLRLKTIKFYRINLATHTSNYYWVKLPIRVECLEFTKFLLNFLTLNFEFERLISMKIIKILKLALYSWGLARGTVGFKKCK